MSFITKENHKGYTMERIWFSDMVESKCDLVRYMRVDKPCKGLFVKNDPFKTVVNDITIPTAEILSKSTKTVKYEVNKCAKEGIQVIFQTANELQNEQLSLLNEFEKAYTVFAEGLNNKQLLKAYSHSKVINLIQNDCILLSKAFIDNISVYHIYAWGNNACCLLYSVSNFRENPSKRNLAGRMNKLLHIRDIDYFRERGVTLYDWGNITRKGNPNGIDIFKMSFGGEVKEQYNVFKANTIKGKLLLLLYKLSNVR